MDKGTFERYRSLIYERSGIALGPQKESLVAARVGKRMRTLNIKDYDAYLDYVVQDQSGDELVHLLDAISTNVTSFFREAVHFDFLRELLTKWYAQGQRRFRIWSAASSTGEEPYSLAITVMEAFGANLPDVKILATDISTRVLEHCMAGRYDAERMSTIPPMLRDKYFDTCRSDNGRMYEVKPALRKLVLFRRLNLSTPPFPLRGPLDVVFCRNVMIYFDNDLRGRLLGDIFRLLKPNGYLMVGHAESLTGMVSKFKTVRPSIYLRE